MRKLASDQGTLHIDLKKVVAAFVSIISVSLLICLPKQHYACNFAHISVIKHSTAIITNTEISSLLAFVQEILLFDK